MEQLSEKLRCCSNVIFVTGAGTGVESGIPTFRGNGSSWWAGPMGLPVMAFFGTTYGWKKAPWLAWPVYDRWMRRPVLRAAPNHFHHLSVRLHSMGKQVHVITENVDGLHQKAGLPRQLVTELHGTLWRNVCAACLEPISESEPTTMDHHSLDEVVPYCPKCNGWPRPAALLFSTRFAQEDLCLPYEHIPYIGHRERTQENTVVIIAGLSGVVGSADAIIRHYSMLLGSQGCFNINPGESKYDQNVNITPIKRPCGEVARELLLQSI